MLRSNDIYELAGGSHPPRELLRSLTGRFPGSEPFIRGALWSIAGIICLVAMYLLLVPSSYTTRWSLILPSATNNSTFSLDSVGQATSSPNSPYGGTQLSPKVIYKEIVESEIVRLAAAETLGMTLIEFGRPKTKLVDETSLLQFEIAAGTPELAQRKAEALLHVFEAKLVRLRADELEKRSAAVKAHIANYQDQVHAARARITAVQTESGLLSTQQFAELLASTVVHRRKLTELRIEFDRAESEQAVLSQRLGIQPERARIALKLAADPSFAKMIVELGDASAIYFAEKQRLGPNHPLLINMAKRRDGALQRISEIALANGIWSQDEIQAMVLLMNTSHQSELFQQLVRNEALIGGKRHEIATMTSELVRLDAEVSRLSTAAAKLEDLRKDHLVADAVLSSAIAKLDTSKTDIYGSYPIVQVLAAPMLPEKRTQPSGTYALLGALIGSLFATLGWMLAWLHHTYGPKRRKSA